MIEALNDSKFVEDKEKESIEASPLNHNPVIRTTDASGAKIQSKPVWRYSGVIAEASCIMVLISQRNDILSSVLVSPSHHQHDRAHLPRRAEPNAVDRRSFGPSKKNHRYGGNININRNYLKRSGNRSLISIVHLRMTWFKAVSTKPLLTIIQRRIQGMIVRPSHFEFPA